MAGPRDLECLFDIFLDTVRDHKRGQSSLTVKERIDQHLKFVPREVVPSLDQKALKKVMILGSGGLSIGQAGEFDYSGSQVSQLVSVLAGCVSSKPDFPNPKLS